MGHMGTGPGAPPIRGPTKQKKLLVFNKVHSYALQSRLACLEIIYGNAHCKNSVQFALKIR
jgi:hypothetical protein